MAGIPYNLYSFGVLLMAEKIKEKGEKLWYAACGGMI